MTATIINLHRPYVVPDATYCEPKSAQQSARDMDDGGRVARQEQQFEYVTMPEGHGVYYAIYGGFLIALVIIVAGKLMGWWA